ncbi:MAG: class I SAM-dependent methyltransferase [Anaerohalosphaeraceae bacterium]|nr:class I SAM-dependent methyltransferase [Anaerohalosphaeraceae bacterium]
MEKITQQDMKELFDATLIEKREDGVRYGPASLHRRRIMKGFAKNITFNSILEIGCGNGYFLKYLLDELNVDVSKIDIAGVDISPNAVDVAKKVLAGNFSVLDVSKNTLESKYGLIICSEVLEHISDYKSALGNIAKMCNGYIIISTPCGPHGDHKKSMIRYYPPQFLKADLEEAGFDVLKIRRWGFPFFTPIHEMIINALVIEKNPLRTGKFGIIKRVLSKILYLVFFLNIPDKGDRVFVLAQKRDAECNKI